MNNQDIIEAIRLKLLEEYPQWNICRVSSYPHPEDDSATVYYFVIGDSDTKDGVSAAFAFYNSEVMQLDLVYNRIKGAIDSYLEGGVALVKEEENNVRD